MAGNKRTDQPDERYEYDAEGDVLDVYFGAKRRAWTVEITDNITVSIDRQTGRAVSLSFLDFAELVRPTSLGPRSFPLTGLADLPLAERELVIRVLTTPPVSVWLDFSTVQTLPDSPFAVTHLETPPPGIWELVPAAG